MTSTQLDPEKQITTCDELFDELQNHFTENEFELADTINLEGAIDEHAGFEIMAHDRQSWRFPKISIMAMGKTVRPLGGCPDIPDRRDFQWQAVCFYHAESQTVSFESVDRDPEYYPEEYGY